MLPFERIPLTVCLLIALTAIAACQRGGDDGASGPEGARSGAPVAAAPTQDSEPASVPTAPGADEPPEGVLRAYVWECDDGSTLAMRNLFRENAVTIDLHEGPRRLNQVPSASGAKYADETLTFWTKGGAARIERQGSPPVNCREVRAKSLAADARARGVEFRGLGNEPGWVLEAGPGSQLVFVTNFGQERHEFTDAVARRDDSSNTIVYEAARGDDGIKATIRREDCTDDMAGTRFDHSFAVEFGGQVLRGCGTALR